MVMPAWMVLGLLIGLLSGLVRVPVAQATETLFVNAKILTAQGRAASALLVRDQKIAALGDSKRVRAAASRSARLIDLQGATLIPGLIDSHIHAIRAGLTYTSEVQWIGVRSLAEALDRLRRKAQHVPAGGWLIVAGGWTENQFAEERGPTQAELAAAAPLHQVYVQWRYSRVLLSPGAYQALGLPADDPQLAGGLKVEFDAEGAPTGWLSGDARHISALYERLPAQPLQARIDGTRAFFRELNAVGITAILDPGGYNMPLRDYRPLFKLWRDEGLSVRVRYSLNAPRKDAELEDFQGLVAGTPTLPGDASLRWNGIGENVTWGMYNNDRPSDDDKDALFRVLRWAAEQRVTASFHWNDERSVSHLLEVLERVDAIRPIAGLRWSIAHLNDASGQSLRRMQALGVGWLVQNGYYFRGLTYLAANGLPQGRGLPAIREALRLGIVVGAGTDAHRVMWYQPFVALQWLIDGKTVEGIPMRSAKESPSRLQALKLYTQGSAWFSFDENERGSLAVGRLADLVVLDRDYFSVPTAQIGAIRSVLTMVGGRIVHGAGRFAALQEPPARPDDDAASRMPAWLNVER